MLHGMPEPKGKSVVTSGFSDSSNLQTCRFTTGVLLFINGTSIRWYYKLQNYVETSTSGCILVDLAVKLCYILKMLVVEVKVTTVLFGDKKAWLPTIHFPILL